MPIPKIIHQIWLGGEPPDWIARCMDSWVTHHPRWRFRLWTEQDCVGLQNQSLYDLAPQMFPDHYHQFRSDLLRYEILAAEGGVYVDSDMECLRPIDALVGKHIGHFACWEIEFKWINQAIIGTTKDRLLFNMLVQDLDHRVSLLSGLKPNVVSGPQYFTLYARHSSITVYPKVFFYPYLWSELHRDNESFPDSYAVHHWNNKRRERATPISAERSRSVAPHRR